MKQTSSLSEFSCLSEYIRLYPTFDARGKFNNASALGRSLYWCQALHIMNKDRYQSTSARRALALLNSPQVTVCAHEAVGWSAVFLVILTF